MPSVPAASDRKTQVAPPFPSLAFPAATEGSREAAANSPRTPAQRDAWNRLVASSYTIVHVYGHDVGLQKRQPTATLPDGRTVQIEWTPDNPEVARWEVTSSDATLPRELARLTPELESMLRVAAIAIIGTDAQGSSLPDIAVEVREHAIRPWRHWAHVARQWLAIYEGRSL